MTLENARGAKVDGHCPYDETTLRRSKTPGKAICPGCWAYFPWPEPLAASPVVTEEHSSPWRVAFGRIATVIHTMIGGKP